MDDFFENPLNAEIQGVPEVQKALDTLKEISANEDEREIYNLRQQTEFGYISEKNVAVEKAHKAGKAEGEKIGIEKGEKRKAIETAKKMLKKGLKVNDIVDFTGLSIAEIDALK